MEKPPASVYAGHMRDDFYAGIQVGQIHPEVTLAVTHGLAAISAFLTDSLGPKRAGAWWAEGRAREKDAALAAVMAIAQVKASGVKLRNLVKDASFEKRGAGKGDKGKDLAPGHEMKQGLNTWHSRGTPANFALTADEAHTGKYSVTYWGTQRAGICERIILKKPGQYQLSVWVKHNDKGARYVVNVLPRTKKKMLPRTKIAVPWKPGQWQQIRTDFTASTDTANISLYVFIHGQQPGAKIWIDDFHVARYPE